MALARIKRWLRSLRPPPVLPADLMDNDPEVEKARRRLRASMRLVGIHAGKSDRAVRKLNRVLKLRAKAIESIGAAEAALTAMDRARGNDK